MAAAAQVSTSMQRKAIVVFSDGTGNSAAKLLKTNVWRLYQALDLGELTPAQSAQGAVRQIAYYDDGVGTSSFKPLALLGGVLGYGLKRNVLDLYMFLCRNYKEGDHIYAFGFSRGGFTIRVLVGLVASQGLLTGRTEEELTHQARDAYRAYRRCFNQTGKLVDVLRGVRDKVITGWRRWHGQEVYPKVRTTPVDKIAFVGVWDTVAAYGMPIAELTRAIDRWVWPLSMPGYTLPPTVEKARHALALDDERDTFHPLLWDEVKEQELIEDAQNYSEKQWMKKYGKESDYDSTYNQKKWKLVQRDRLKQIWFAGMHSDVGGGYPDDSLAYVSLQWMMQEAEAGPGGLRFTRFARKEVERVHNEHGPMHDSRRGLGGYYRYQPRKISAWLDPPDRTALIMRDPDRGKRGLLRSVTVHDSVLNRIKEGTAQYAPVVLPPHGVGLNSGQGQMSNYDIVWNEIWRRRVTYFATLGVSLVLFSMVCWDRSAKPPICEWPQCLLVPTIRGTSVVVPEFLESWIDAFAYYPGWFAILVGTLVLLLIRGGYLQRRSHDAMRGLWNGAGPRHIIKPRKFDQFIYRFRTASSYQKLLRFLKWKLVPDIFGVVFLVLVVVLPALYVFRTWVASAEQSNAICEMSSGSTEQDTVGGLFDPRALCSSTGTPVEEGRRYRISLTVTRDWLDKGIPVSPAGFGSEGLPWYIRLGAAPLRRSFGDEWFQPIAKIVPANEKQASVVHGLKMEEVSGQDGRYTAEFEAEQSGQLYLFVNDALLPWPGSLAYFYNNNEGEARVQIEPVEWCDAMDQSSI